VGFANRGRPPGQLQSSLREGPAARASCCCAEGGTPAYLIRIGGRQILAFGSMNYIEREVEGLRPDVALIGAMPERREIFEYTPRLLRALGYPPLVLPTHWDRFNVPYDASQEPAIQRLQPFLAEVKSASPKTRVLVPKYSEPIAIPVTPPTPKNDPSAKPFTAWPEPCFLSRACQLTTTLIGADAFSVCPTLLARLHASAWCLWRDRLRPCLPRQSAQ